jgi:LmbE family N-acetylglucosaminyl deacetylase
VLVLVPHPDDEVAGCGGTILLHRVSGDDVVLCFVGDGRRSRALGIGSAEMAEVRRAEAHTAARALGVTHVEWFGLTEGEWSVKDLHAALRTMLASVRPSVVYAPSIVDYHPEHWRVAAGLASALRDGRVDAPRVRAYEVQVPLTPRLTNLVASIDAVVEPLRDAFDAYRSQRASLRRCWRMKRYAAASHGTGRWAEPFWELSAYDYARLHPAALDGEALPFLGLRHLPFRDPLAYLGDRRRRLRLLDLIDA